MVWPGLVDVHTHLDKGHVWPRTQNPDGTFMGALTASAEDRRRYWTAEDVARRMDFSLRCAYAHGTVAIRTHLNSEPPQDAITWPVFCDMRRRWAGKIHLQPVCLIALEKMVEPLATELADLAAQSDGVLGAFTNASHTLDADLQRVFRLAHLDRPIGDWPAAVARTPSAIMRLEAGVIRAGAKADLIICEGRTFDEVLSRPQSRRIVLRDGQPIDTMPPDYRELDDLF